MAEWGTETVLKRFLIERIFPTGFTELFTAKGTSSAKIIFCIIGKEKAKEVFLNINKQNTKLNTKTGTDVVNTYNNVIKHKIF